MAETERWLAPVLNYLPAQDQSAQDRRVKEAMPKLAPSSAVPANDVVSGPVVQPILIGSEATPPATPRRGWWRRG